MKGAHKKMSPTDDDFRRMTTLEKLSRRSFLSRTGAAGVTTTATVIASSTETPTQQVAETDVQPRC